MPNDEMFYLIRRCLSGGILPKEKKKLDQWLSDDASHRAYFETVKKVWQVTPNHEVDVNFKEEWRRISLQLGIEKDNSRTKSANAHAETKSTSIVPLVSNSNLIKQLVRVAAVILLVAIPAYYYSDFSNRREVSASSQEVTMQKTQTAIGERAKMTFSDGSQIMLNSKSTIRFPKVFKGSKREVYLEGEAFFEVAHNEDVPFIVHSNGVAIKVLGTEFNVDGYKEEQQVEVVVRDGKVAVKRNRLNTNKDPNNRLKSSDQSNRREVILTKGQRSLVKSGEAPSSPQNVSLKPYLAWVNGRMLFEGTPMKKVILQLERAYNLNFEVQDSSLLSERLKASFKRERPGKVLDIIAFSLGIKYDLNGHTVIFKSKN